MAYPTGIAFTPVESRVGSQPINQSYGAAKHTIGDSVRAKDVHLGAAEFLYLEGTQSTVAGSMVAYNLATGHTFLTTSTSRGPVAVAMSDNGAGSFGWYCVSGAVPVKSATVAANTQAYPTSTAGQLDDTASVSLQISGAKFVTSDSGGFATLNLNYPSIEADVGSGGGSGITSFAAVGSSPNAAAVTVSGPTATLQPADPTHPGVITTGAQTVAGPKTWSDAAVFGSTIAATGAVTGSNLTGTNTGDYSKRYPQTVYWSPTASSITGAANRCWLLLVEISAPCQMDQVTFQVGSSSGGNFIVGVYGPVTPASSETALGASLIAQSGSTTHTGAPGTVLGASLSTGTIAKGLYYVALHVSSSSGLVYGHANTRTVVGSAQYFDQTYGALPNVVPALGSSNLNSSVPILQPRCV